MWTDTLQPAIPVVTTLGVTIAAAFAVLFSLRARHRSQQEQIAHYLDKHQPYFAYVSIHIDGTEPLLPPPGRLEPLELKAIQTKLLEWIETIDGSHRHKLIELCRELGLIELERQRLRSARHSDRIDAAYHLGVMRAHDCTDELIAMLDREKSASTAFVVGRAVAKCAAGEQDLKRLVLKLAEYHPQSCQLIADIVASSSLDPLPVYSELLQSDSEPAVITALIGLSACNAQGPAPVLEQLAKSGRKEVRIKASKLLLQYPHLLSANRLGQLLQSPDWEIRAAAVKTVGEHRLSLAFSFLAHSLSDDNWWVRHYGAQSLALFGLQGFQTLCRTARDTDNKLCREMALNAIRDGLEQAAITAAGDTRQALYYNELCFTYRKTFNENVPESLIQAFRHPFNDIHTSPLTPAPRISS